MNERKKIIQNLLNRKFSYRKIGDLLGISGQRVHQIVTRYISPSERSQEPINGSILNKIIKGNIEIKHGEIAKITGMSSGSRDRIRELIRIRDNHTCQICLKKWKKGERRFDVHHEDEHLEGLNKGKGYVKIDRKVFNRMITLCHKCHLNLDSVRKKMGRKSY